MPTGSETKASDQALAEAELWRRVATDWSGPGSPLPTERATIPETDPTADLRLRGDAWGFVFGAADLAELSRFAGALALVEAEAWRSADGSLATRAYADRRFVFGDRILPWAVPWLIAAARDGLSGADRAQTTSRQLLQMADHHRPAPDLAVGEGLHLPGHDGYGPQDQPADLTGRLRSLWGGLAVIDEVGPLPPGPSTAERYGRAAANWVALAEAHPGSARCWLDLAARASRTAAALRRIA